MNDASRGKSIFVESKKTGMKVENRSVGTRKWLKRRVGTCPGSQVTLSAKTSRGRLPSETTLSSILNDGLHYSFCFHWKDQLEPREEELDSDVSPRRACCSHGRMNRNWKAQTYDGNERAQRIFKVIMKWWGGEVLWIQFLIGSKLKKTRTQVYNLQSQPFSSPKSERESGKMTNCYLFTYTLYTIFYIQYYIKYCINVYTILYRCIHV